MYRLLYAALLAAILAPYVLAAPNAGGPAAGGGGGGGGGPHESSHEVGGGDVVSAEDLSTACIENEHLTSDGAGALGCTVPGNLMLGCSIEGDPSRVTILKGSPVFLTQYATGDIGGFELADADDGTEMPALGIAGSDLDTVCNQGDPDHVVLSGPIQGLDTQTPGWGLGTELYVSINGACTTNYYNCLTSTKPVDTGTNVQKIAQVTRVDLTNGNIVVFGAGRANDLPNIEDNRVWVGNAVDQPVARLLPTGCYDANEGLTWNEGTGVFACNTMTGTPAGSGTEIQFRSAGAFAADADFFYTTGTDTMDLKIMNLADYIILPDEAFHKFVQIDTAAGAGSYGIEYDMESSLAGTIRYSKGRAPNATASIDVIIGAAEAIVDSSEELVFQAGAAGADDVNINDELLVHIRDYLGYFPSQPALGVYPDDASTPDIREHETKIYGNFQHWTEQYIYTQADSPVTVSVDDVYDTDWYSNRGASSTVQFNLPDAVQGMHFRVTLLAAQDVDIDPNSTETIGTCGSGEILSSPATIGSMVELAADSDTHWELVHWHGQWDGAAAGCTYAAP